MNTPAIPPPLPPVPRSTFVNATAWITLCLSGLGLLMLALQAAMFLAAGRAGLFARMQEQLALDPQASAFLSMALEWLPWLAVLFTVQNLLFVTASVGLLKRREWGRKLFIALLVLLIVWQIVMIPLQWSMVGYMQGLMMMGQEVRPEMQAVMQAQMEATTIISRLFGAAFGLVFCVLFAWLAWKLRSPQVRAEFAAARLQSSGTQF